MSNDLAERFMQRVSPEPNSGCWLWTGPYHRKGYGQFYLKGKQIMAHRFSYEMERGKIPEGLMIDHLCRNKSCVNPHHLECVTNRINTRRGVAHARSLGRDYGEGLICKRGHKLTAKNTRINEKKRLHECTICRSMEKRAWKRRKAARKRSAA